MQAIFLHMNFNFQNGSANGWRSIENSTMWIEHRLSGRPRKRFLNRLKSVKFGKNRIKMTFWNWNLFLDICKIQIQFIADQRRFHPSSFQDKKSSFIWLTDWKHACKTCSYYKLYEMKHNWVSFQTSTAIECRKAALITQVSI